MTYKLEINASKGRWKDINVDSYMSKMQEEIVELKEALGTDNTVSILLEAADVANFALIIASKELDGEK
jgi:NTP pyrophosphatase (non-canonical NTP hydrolase)